MKKGFLSGFVFGYFVVFAVIRLAEVSQKKAAARQRAADEQVKATLLKGRIWL